MSVLKYAPEALKNLFRPPVTTSYPFKPFEPADRTRGRIEIEIDQCIGCGMCVRACPSSALTVDKNAGKWTINRFDCIACGFCVEKCPKKCLSMQQFYQEPGPEKNEVTYTKSPEVLAEEARKREEAAKKAAEAKAAMEAKKAAEAAAAAKEEK
ncbi:MAG: 4Fe-4S dicluster domain-containing protein [Lachnospiraceae bacterium]|nr:4Fe-4S dicluster domain-containing protein [Lachnospiraceae bacterium]